jgi:hypothetical protein
MAFNILSALLGWFGATYVYSLLPASFKQHHPIWSGGFAGGIVGLGIPPIISRLQTLLEK